MPIKTYAIGSQQWLEEVFSSPPVRRLKGRSRYTQYHEVWSPLEDRPLGVQGRLEHVASLLLLYLQRNQAISRIKSQPFQAPFGKSGSHIVPDFLAEAAVHNERHHVIEVKTQRYVSAEDQRILDRNRELFSEKNLNYYVWTDAKHLTRPTRHNLINMHRCASAVPIDVQKDLQEFIYKKGPHTIGELQKYGFDKNVVFAASWNQNVFFRITEDFKASLPVKIHPQENYKAIFLGGQSSLKGWWNDLSSYTAKEGNA